MNDLPYDACQSNEVFKLVITYDNFSRLFPLRPCNTVISDALSFRPLAAIAHPFYHPDALSSGKSQISGMAMADDPRFAWRRRTHLYPKVPTADARQLVPAPRRDASCAGGAVEFVHAESEHSSVLVVVGSIASLGWPTTLSAPYSRFRTALRRGIRLPWPVAVSAAALLPSWYMYMVRHIGGLYFGIVSGMSHAARHTRSSDDVATPTAAFFF